jgi:ECF sigma factor
MRSTEIAGVVLEMLKSASAAPSASLTPRAKPQQSRLPGRSGRKECRVPAVGHDAVGSVRIRRQQEMAGSRCARVRIGPRDPDFNLLALDRALEALATVDERKSRVIEMRFFSGMTVEETAEALHVSSDTVKRDWRLAKLWLLRELEGQGSLAPPSK